MRERFERECPLLMSYGMSRDEYWNGSIYAAFDYVEAFILKQKRVNHEAWLYGRYVFDAVGVVVANALGSKNDTKYSYPERPYGYELTEEEKQIEEENEKLQAKAFMNNLISVGKNWGKER